MVMAQRTKKHENILGYISKISKRKKADQYSLPGRSREAWLIAAKAFVPSSLSSSPRLRSNRVHYFGDIWFQGDDGRFEADYRGGRSSGHVDSGTRGLGCAPPAPMPA